MICPSEERLALHACGDALDAAVEGHLAACAACRTLADAYRDDAALFQFEPRVPESTLNAVAEYVRDRTHARRVPVRVWAVATAAAVLALAMWLRPSNETAAPTVAQHPDPVAHSAPPAPQAVAAVHKRRAAPRRRPAPEDAPEQTISVVPQSDGAVVIAKKTADPNVVILLVAEEEPASGESDDK